MEAFGAHGKVAYLTLPFGALMRALSARGDAAVLGRGAAASEGPPIMWRAVEACLVAHGKIAYLSLPFCALMRA